MLLSLLLIAHIDEFVDKMYLFFFPISLSLAPYLLND
ncbi:hypothetical protein ES703_54348 [subsurface metagenome]